MRPCPVERPRYPMRDLFLRCSSFPWPLQLKQGCPSWIALWRLHRLSIDGTPQGAVGLWSRFFDNYIIRHNIKGGLFTLELFAAWKFPILLEGTNVNRRLVSLLVASALLLLTLPAAASPDQQESTQNIPPAQDSPTTKRPKDLDDLLVEIGRIAPGFGGMSFNSQDQVLEVYSLDLNEGPVLTKAFAAVFGATRVPRNGIRVRQGDYSVLQLAQWYESVRNKVLTLDGVVATDLHEGKNRLWVGIEDETVRTAVDAQLDSLGIPKGAVIIEVTGPIVSTVLTIRDSVRPVDGGVQITNGTSGKICTYGFTTLKDGTTLGMVTAAHCTGTEGYVDSVAFYQPSGSDSTTRVGWESIDPPLFNNSQNSRCPAGKACRYSDSTFVTGGSLTLNRGYIARPNGIGSITIDSTNPRFRITAEGSFMTGDTVSKVGRTSGLTSGSVSQTCYDGASESGVYYLCQGVAEMVMQPGDSGSPVFKGSSDVTLVGLAWGAIGTKTVFSSLGSVYMDLGASSTWDSCASGYNC